MLVATEDVNFKCLAVPNGKVQVRRAWLRQGSTCPFGGPQTFSLPTLLLLGPLPSQVYTELSLSPTLTLGPLFPGKA